MDSIEIYVATHKKQNINLPAYCHYIQVNAEKNGRWPGYIHDNDSKDNISLKNESFCELTALYTLWKNSSASIQGLFHYRRFFSGNAELTLQNEANTRKNREEICGNIIDRRRIDSLLKNTDIILEIPSAPSPLTVYEDLQKFVYVEDIWKMIDIIQHRYPEYAAPLWEVLKSTKMSYCNMFIARKRFVDEYCSWLFRLLAEIEEVTCIDEYDKNHKRIYGYLAEVLLNVYIKRNKIKTSYVYRVDLLEEGTYNKYKVCIKNKLNNIITKFGVYPLGDSRRIYKARYLSNVNANHKGLIICAGPDDKKVKQIKYYFKSCGCNNIQVVKYDDGYMVSAGSIFAKIIVIIAANQAAVTEILDKIRYDTEERQFGNVTAYRIFSHEELKDEFCVAMLRNGFTIIYENNQDNSREMYRE